MSDPRERFQPITACALSMVCVLLSGISSAKPSIILSRKSGPPTSAIFVSGRGFEANVGVDIYFGTKDEVARNPEMAAGEGHVLRPAMKVHPGQTDLCRPAQLHPDRR